MKLSSQQVVSVKTALGADPLEDHNPAMDSLVKAFGEHTFYVFTDGLFVLEPVNDAAMAGDPARLVLVAAWTDEKRNALQKVQPQATDAIVDLSAGPATPDT
ncbi:MAG: hypothetical protein R3F55_20875 [Alphaproteobacteria bacterium]